MRISRSLARYFEGLAHSQQAQAKALVNLSSPAVIQSPLLEESLFLPSTADSNTPGWGSFLAHLRVDISAESEKHIKLAKVISEEVITVLNKVRVELKNNIASLEGEVNPAADAVHRSRVNYNHALSQLSKSLALLQTTPGAMDPFVTRALTEHKSREFSTKSNEMLSLTLKWQEKAREIEVDVFDQIKKCIKTWEDAKIEFLKTDLEATANTGKKSSALKSDAEWNFFKTLHHLLPPKTAPIALEPQYEGRNHESTVAIKSGHLERKKRFSQNWKKAYFILTPSGFLHEYTYDMTTPDTPHISLYLPHCTIGTIQEHEFVPGEALVIPTPPSPSTPTPIETVPTASAAFKATQLKPLPAGQAAPTVPYKFYLEGRRAIHGSIGVGHSELSRILRSNSKEEIQTWWDEISKFTKAETPHNKFFRRPSAVTEQGGRSEALDAEGGKSDDEAFDEARTKVEEPEAINIHPKSPGDKGLNLLNRAKSTKIVKKISSLKPNASPPPPTKDDTTSPAKEEPVASTSQLPATTATAEGQSGIGSLVGRMMGSK